MDDEFSEESADDTRDARQGIQSVEVAAVILEALGTGTGALTLTEISARTHLKPNKIHRYLISLIRAGLASQSVVSGRYDLGPAMRRIGGAALRRTNEVAIAAEYSAALRDASAQSVNLSVWGDDGPVVVRWDYGSYALPLTLRVGTGLSVLGSAAGRVFLTFLPEAMTADALLRSQASRHTPMTSAEVAQLRSAVRAEGYAVMTGALIPGATAISAPIFTPSDTLPFAMSIVVPGEHLNDDAIADARDKLLDSCNRLSIELGVSPEDRTSA